MYINWSQFYTVMVQNKNPECMWETDNPIYNCRSRNYVLEVQILCNVWQLDNHTETDKILSNVSSLPVEHLGM